MTIKHEVQYDDAAWPCWCGIDEDHYEEFMMPCGRTIQGLQDALAHIPACDTCPPEIP